ncbi:hypothetical protein Hthe01_13490 [Hydrogenophilus thermoluteolus]|uniref:sensor histidine kinase n=1 Tax=Hydrogenophilus thermoluteolus TaxID=297 RepID=UPI0024A12F07|nr:ATP-binding protein [Hydrogenophilus thermoluteolus]GLW61000.1 hypothetical protein Hthe01_13490 [Hydrogenophilus thermoluteolus]
MNATWLPWIAGASLIAGLVVLSVLAWLLRDVQRIEDAAERLLQANAANDCDAHRFPAAAWPILHAVGVKGMHVAWQWYGVRYEMGWGDTNRPRTVAIPFSAQVPNLSVHGTLWVPWAKGERRYFAKRLADTLQLCLLLDLWRTAAATETGFALWSRTATLLLHDVKNLAQFVLYLPVTLESPDDASSDRRSAHRMLAAALPAATERATRILSRLTHWSETTQATDVLHPIALTPFLEAECARLGGCVPIEGEAIVAAVPERLREIVQELWENSERHQGTLTRIAVRRDDAAHRAEVAFAVAVSEPVTPQHVARWFQPFFSGDGQGSGLGLFQAQWAARACHGDLTARVEEGGVVFCLTLPLYGKGDRPESVDRVE